MTDYSEYYKNAMKDIEEVKSSYPWTEILVPPTAHAQRIILEVIAVNKTLIDMTAAGKEYFCGEYSRLLKVVIPYDYRSIGCWIPRPAWIDVNKIPLEYQHFNDVLAKGDKLLLCVGVPESFPNSSNVVLENIKTAEYMLSAYEALICGKTKKLELLSYSHGEEGKNEYKRNKRNSRNRR